MLVINNTYEILTPYGFEPFFGVRKTCAQSHVVVTFDDGHVIKCTPDHKFFVNFEEIQASDVKIGQKLNDARIVSDVCFEETELNVYDPVEVESHAYIADGIVNHNCDFLGSSATLISSSKLYALTYVDPVHTTNEGHIRYYEEVKRDRTYIVVVDTAEGVGADNSALVVFDTTELPYKVVCAFTDNNIHPIMYPKYILDVAKYYNDAQVLIETNNMGSQVADILHDDLEYENIIATNSSKNTVLASMGFSGRSNLGVRTTKKVKTLGCATLKSLVENDRIVINDFELKHELTKFVFNKNTYEAESGYTDDLVMCCVLFSWLTTQTIFKELTNTDAVKNIYEENARRLDDTLTPVGIYDNGRDFEKVELTISEFDRWFYT